MGIKALVGSILAEIAAGWSSKLVDTITDSLWQAALHIAIIVGGVAVILVVAVEIVDDLEDIAGYVAAGFLAIPAIVTYLLPWDWSTDLFAVAFIINVVVFGKALILPDFD